MTRLEKCELLKFKGYTYYKETGKIFGVRGKEIIRKDDRGYILISNHFGNQSLLGHHYAWYMTYGNVDFEMLDHINRDKSDNRICNLRIVNNQKNAFNTNAKGYYFHKNTNKWRAQIQVEKKRIHLGLFNTEEEARNVYLEAKKKYHII